MKKMKKALALLLAAIMVGGVALPNVAKAAEPVNLFDATSTDNIDNRLTYNGTYKDSTTNYANMFSSHKISVSYGDIVYWGGVGAEDYVACLYDANGTFIQQIRNNADASIGTAGLKYVETGNTVLGYANRERKELNFGLEITNQQSASIIVIGNISTKNDLKVYKNLEDTTGWPTIEKTVVPVTAENLFNKDDADNALQQLRLNGSTTAVDTTKYGNLFSTHYIPVENGDILYWGDSGDETNIMAIYDSNKTFLKQVKIGTDTVERIATGGTTTGYNGSSRNLQRFAYKIETSGAAYVSIVSNIDVMDTFAVYKNLEDTTGWPTIAEPEVTIGENLFDKDSADNALYTLRYNGTERVDATKYANLFSTHYIPVADGDIMYWGDSGDETYIMAIYDSNKTFIQQVNLNSDPVERITTSGTTSGYNGGSRNLQRFAYKINNADAAYVTIFSNISQMESFAVYKNLEDTTGWPTITPPVDVEVEIDEGVVEALTGKKILFLGDSITAATKDDKKLGGWAGRVGTNYGAITTNAGWSGASVSTNKSDRIIAKMEANKTNTYDYVILHGGVNDAMTKAPLGAVSDSKNVADFDISTYAGALEELIYRAKEYFPNAKVGFIVNYATPNSTWGGYTPDMAAYFHTAKQVCEKWGIPYIDLFFGSADVNGKMLSYSWDILDVDNAIHFYGQTGTEVHIGGTGYDIITPHIAAFIASIGVEDDGNLFDKNSEGNLKNTLKYNGNTKKDTTAYANLFTTHMIPVERGDVLYWGDCGSETYIAALYDKEGNFIHQVLYGEDPDLGVIETSGTTTGFNGGSRPLKRFAYEVKDSKACYVTIFANIDKMDTFAVYKNLDDTTGWPTLRDTNLFDRDSKDNKLATLAHGARTTTDLAKYSNMFTTHLMPVENGDVVYWGGVGCEDYVLRLYDAEGKYIQQIRNNSTAGVGTEGLAYTKTGVTTTGYNYSTKDVVNFAYEIANEQVAYMTVTGNITELDNLQVFVNLSNTKGWPTLVPGVDDSNPLKGKTALFVGDSITYGGTDGGWVSRIGRENSLIATNAGVSGSAISITNRVANGDRKRILTQLENNKANTYDYVIMHGGMNDAWDSWEVGSVSDSFDLADFDNTTYAGGLEELFYYAKQYFPDATLGFIVNYATPMSTTSGSAATSGVYFRMAKEVCEKWGIPYIDLFDGEVEVDGKMLSYSYDILKVEEATNFRASGDVHINADGYDIISPYISDWMRKLDQGGLNGASLTLEGKIKMNYYMVLSDKVLANEHAYVRFTRGDEVVEFPVAEGVDSDYGYAFPFQVSAKNMTDEITVQLFSGDYELSEPEKFSVYEYASIIIFEEEMNGTYGPKAAALAKAMLNYGGYAQEYFGYNTDNFANQDLSVEEKDLTSVTAESIADHKRGEQANAAIGRVAGSNLSLKESTVLKIYFKLADGVDASALTFAVDGTEVEAVKNGAYYQVSIEGIAAHNLDTVYTITVSDGTNTLTATYSAMTYVYNILSRDRAQELKDVMAALRLYNLAADAYKEGV